MDESWRLSRYPYTTVALILAVIGLLAAVFLHTGVFDIPWIEIIGIERSEASGVAIGFLLVIPAFFIDRVVARQRAHEAQLAAERLRVVQVTMRTVQDIVINSLNELQILRLDAEGHVPSDSIRLFDQAIADATAKLRALGDLQVYAEKKMAIGTGLDVASR